MSNFFLEISHYAFKRNEQPTTIFNLGDNTSIAFAKSILLVGTCLLDDEDQSLEPKSGRILTFSIDKRTRSLSYLSQIAVGGAVYALQVCSTVGTNTRFLATVNGSVS